MTPPTNPVGASGGADAPMTDVAAICAENETLRQIIRDTMWMACRYAHGRQSYAVAMYNAAARKANELGALDNRPARQEPIFAIDGTLMREMSGLTEAEFADALAGWREQDAVPNFVRSALMKDKAL